MPLSPSAELSPAEWITTSDRPWDQLVGFGPAGFPAYARLRFLPDPAYPGQSENDVEVDEAALSETDQVRMVLDVLAGYTSTPNDCYFCLWEGWGLQGITSPPMINPRPDSPTRHPATDPSLRVEPSPAFDLSFRAPALREPLVVVPNRAYLLFYGSVTDLGDRGSATRWPGQPSLGSADPAFIWPADHAWCVANDVDPHWAGIGATTSAIDELIADTRLDVALADPRTDQPHYR